jgi:hypothetical protein
MDSCQTYTIFLDDKPYHKPPTHDLLRACYDAYEFDTRLDTAFTYYDNDSFALTPDMVFKTEAATYFHILNVWYVFVRDNPYWSHVSILDPVEPPSDDLFDPSFIEPQGPSTKNTLPKFGIGSLISSPLFLITIRAFRSFTRRISPIVTTYQSRKFTIDTFVCHGSTQHQLYAILRLQRFPI